ncbi:MAG: plasma-membrane proton-efflux P-type ATPase [Bryobacteraceae bacterium]|jgi:H+-transporting ATPase
MDADASPATSSAPSGLTTQEAAELLAKLGPNSVAEEREHPLRVLWSKLWAPVPWMLEAAALLEILLHKNIEAGVIAGLVVFNAGLSFFQESHAQGALALLRRRLTIQVRVRRDGAWQRLPAERLVPGDTIHLRVGDMVPADARLSDGNVLIDHSAVTGESAPIEASPGYTTYAGGLIKRGEATAVVIATGSHTYFGKTAELVRQANAAGHLQQMIFTIVKYLVAFDVLLASLVLVYALRVGMGLGDILPFCVMLLVASIPVALPATFTLACALGTQELAHGGVLVSRLSAIEEAAAMDVLATDKTGTLTKNELSVAIIEPMAPYSEADLIRFAALASDDATQDPIDLAILATARSHNVSTAGFTVRKFVPFEPSTKCSEALVQHGTDQIRIIKGAPSTIATFVGMSGFPEAEKLAGDGYRVLAVATGSEQPVATAGFLALLDPPRDDSAHLVANLQQLGVRVLMITGDGPATARTVATQVGITGGACPPERLRADPERAASECDVFAGVFPEDKFQLVRALQHAGHIVGMTGDGVNDAPALKQAEVGVAVANATDVAKAAASIVLTNPGLSDVVSAIETSRRIYQRMLTYTLNKIIKTIEIALFLSLGVVLMHVLVVTPLLIVLLLFTNDFVTMSIATDRVSFSKRPDRWRIKTLVLTAAPLAGLLVLFSLSVLFAGRNILALSTAQIQTLAFLTLVFGGQGTIYLVRERGHFWHSQPSRWMLLSSIADLVIVGILATRGILMASLPLFVVEGLLGAVVVYLFVVDCLKIAIFRHFEVA